MFRRHTPAEPHDPQSPPGQLNPDAPAAETVGETADETREGRKGHATPTRKEAERLRRERLAPPRDRKKMNRETRAQIKAERARSRRALLSGDQRHLPARDAGPVRALARDYVDARRCAAEFFLPGALLVLVLSLPRNLTMQSIAMFVWLGMIVLIVVDSVLVSRGLSRQARERFPGEPHKGLVAYALMRTMQIRRLRLPPPRVRTGDQI